MVHKLPLGNLRDKGPWSHPDRHLNSARCGSTGEGGPHRPARPRTRGPRSRGRTRRRSFRRSPAPWPRAGRRRDRGGDVDGRHDLGLATGRDADRLGDRRRLRRHREPGPGVSGAESAVLRRTLGLAPDRRRQRVLAAGAVRDRGDRRSLACAPAGSCLGPRRHRMDRGRHVPDDGQRRNPGDDRSAVRVPRAARRLVDAAALAVGAIGGAATGLRVGGLRRGDAVPLALRRRGPGRARRRPRGPPPNGVVHRRQGRAPSGAPDGPVAAPARVTGRPGLDPGDQHAALTRAGVDRCRTARRPPGGGRRPRAAAPGRSVAAGTGPHRRGVGLRAAAVVAHRGRRDRRRPVGEPLLGRRHAGSRPAGRHGHRSGGIPGRAGSPVRDPHGRADAAGPAGDVRVRGRTTSRAGARRSSGRAPRSSTRRR